MKVGKVYQRLCRSQANVRFADFCRVIEAFGYRYERTRGSHVIYDHPMVEESLNLQKVGGQAKPYQVRQFLRSVERHGLVMRDPS